MLYCICTELGSRREQRYFYYETYIKISRCTFRAAAGWFHLRGSFEDSQPNQLNVPIDLRIDCLLNDSDHGADCQSKDQKQHV